MAPRTFRKNAISSSAAVSLALVSASSRCVDRNSDLSDEHSAESAAAVASWHTRRVRARFHRGVKRARKAHLSAQLGYFATVLGRLD